MLSRRSVDSPGIRDEDLLLDGEHPADNITAVEQAQARGRQAD